MKMTSPVVGGIAQSKQGRDKGRYYLIVGIEQGGLIALTDGNFKKGSCGIAVKAVLFGGDINAYDVAVKNNPVAGDAVNDYFVDGHARTCGIAFVAELRVNLRLII